MDDIIIRAENLGKLYRIGKHIQHKTLRDTISTAFPAVLRKLNQSSKSKNEDDYVWALKNISFEVKRGEAIGIIGRNGAGKSTLLKILSRITPPTEGYAQVQGRIASLLEVGTGFHPELTGRDNIYLNGAILGMKKQEINHRFDEIVAFAEIGKFIDTPVKHYSSGMYVRLAFAIAAHLEPDVLLVDEVLAVGDIAFQKKCLGKMDGIAKENRTVLFVSHNMAVISNFCKKCLLLEMNRNIMYDQTENVIDYYLSQLDKTPLIPLNERQDRKGDGRLRFIDTWVENAEGRKISCVKSGEKIKIVALYKVKEDIGISNLTVAFGVSTIMGIQLTDLCNSIAGDYFIGKIPCNGRIECSIPKLPLNSGTYFYNVIARSNNSIEDWIIHAGRFNVESSDYFGSGRTIDSKQGMFLIDQKWTLTEQ